MSEYKEWSLTDWQNMFKEIYSERNSSLSGTQGVYYIILGLMEKVGEFSEQMGDETHENLENCLPGIFAWLCAYSDTRGISIEQVAWAKYPAICPYCKNSRCGCDKNREAYDPNNKTLVNKRNINRPPRTIKDWETQFSKIYGQKNKNLSRASIGYHLIEEVGELAKKIRKLKDDEVEIEIADVFAWIMAVRMKMQKDIKPIDEMLWDVYPDKCNKCRKKPCDCRPFNIY